MQLTVTVGTDGRAKSVTVLSDPGSGFGAQAKTEVVTDGQVVETAEGNPLDFIAQYQQGSTDTLHTRSNNFNFELRFRKRY